MGKTAGRTKFEISPRLQVFDVRYLVDSPGHHFAPSAGIRLDTHPYAPGATHDSRDHPQSSSQPSRSTGLQDVGGREKPLPHAGKFRQGMESRFKVRKSAEELPGREPTSPRNRLSAKRKEFESFRRLHGTATDRLTAGKCRHQRPEKLKKGTRDLGMFFVFFCQEYVDGRAEVSAVIKHACLGLE